MLHHTRVSIYLRAFEQNLNHLKRQLPPSCRICAVVKADAYGHGIRAIVPVAAGVGVDCMGIADNWEAAAIRDLNISCPILRLRPATVEEMIEAREWDVDEVIGDWTTALMFSEYGERSGRAVPIHLKLDVGIGRMGFTYPLHRQVILRVLSLKGVQIKGVMTHFPCADEDDLGVTTAQLRHYEKAVEELRDHLPEHFVRHVANSAAALRLSASAQSMVRLGIAMYGLRASNHQGLYDALQPVMEWSTRVVQVRSVPTDATIGYGMTHRLNKEARIATLPIGYADAYPLGLSNKGEVLIHGQRCPVVGRVSMDMVTVDVSHLKSVSVGDETVLLGGQGGERITAEEIAQHIECINYVIPCMVGKSNYNRVEIE